MALIKCSECGKEISDKASTCPNCGCPVIPASTGPMAAYQASAIPSGNPMPVQANYYPPKPDSGRKKEAVVGIIGLILSFLFCLPIFPGIGLILCIIAICDKKHSSVCAKIGIVVCIMSIILGIASPQFMKYVDRARESSMESSSAGADLSPLSEESAVSSSESAETSGASNDLAKDEFIASCEEIPYKTLARYPEENKGKHIVLTVSITQIVQGGLFNDSVYYRVYTDNDGYGFYLSDEYLMYDSRIDDSTKLLESDIVKVYGEFIGTESITRALTGTTEEVPALKAYYIEILDENATGASGTGEPATVGTATKDKFDQIERGMTYEEVVEIMGSEGELLSSVELMDMPTTIYYWYGEDGISNANVTFQNNSMVSKAQIGLE